MKSYSSFDLLIGGLLMALALVFPVVFHAIGLGGAFLPMFYPILAAGFLIVLPAAVVVGILSPLVSAVLTGMPPFYPPVAFMMMFEGLFLALVPGILYRRFKWNIWLSVLITMLVERMVMLIAIYIITKWMEFPTKMISIAALVKGIPGTLIIIILMPPLLKKLDNILSTYKKI